MVDIRGARNGRSRRHRNRTGDEDFEGDAESPLTAPAPDVSSGVASPLAPRASPEPSEVDPVSSPRWPRGSLVTPPGSADGSPPLGASSLLVPRLSTGSTTAERQEGVDFDYYNSLRFANTEKGIYADFYGADQHEIIHVSDNNNNNNNNNLHLLGLTSNRAINTVQHPPRRAGNNSHHAGQHYIQKG